MKLYSKLYTMKMEHQRAGSSKYQRIEAFTLGNGVKVFYDHVTDTPLVSIQVWVHAGSADEPSKIAGISHLIEHMFFKGTSVKHIAAIAKEIEALGGYINAFTSFEETVFYITIRNDYFARALEVLAQTINNPLFDENELKMEREVVLDEIKRGKDDNYQTLFLSLYDLAYKKHPYGRPIIGYENTVGPLSRDRILGYYRQWYTPSNINLVIVGDVPRQQVEQGVYGAFGSIPHRGSTKHSRPKCPEQKQQRGLVRKLDVKDTYYAMGFVTPPASSPDSFSLEVLAYILGGNDASRLQRIVKKESGLVDSIAVSHSSNRYTGFFGVSGTTEPGKLKGALDSIMNTIADTRIQLPTQEEISRAKQMLKSAFVYDLETVKHRAMKIGEAVVEMGGLDYIMDYTRNIDSVSSESIEAAIGRHLNRHQLNVVTIVPKAKPLPRGSASVARPVVAAHAGVSSGYDLTHSGDIVMASFENGLRVIVKEKHAIPSVAVSAVFLGDMTEEPEDKAGLINLMSIMLKKGTHYRKESDIERECDGISGMFGYLRTKQTFGMTGEFLNSYTDDGLSLFSDMLLHSTFDPGEIARTKKDIIADLRVDKDNIGLQARNAFLKLIYGQTPLSRSEKGSAHTVNKIARGDLTAVYDRLVCSKNGVISIVGDINRMDIIKKVARYLSGIKTGRHFPPLSHKLRMPVHETRTENYRMEKNQAHIITGMPTIPVNHGDRFAIMLLDQILGGQSGRLFVELRDKRGICYAVQTIGEAKLNNKGWFGIYTSTSPEKAGLSLDVIGKELQKLYSRGINDMELENSKRYMLSDYDNRKQMALSISNMLAYNELFDRSIDYYNRLPQLIRQVTREEVNAVIRKYFAPERFTTLVLVPD